MCCPHCPILMTTSFCAGSEVSVGRLGLEVGGLRAWETGWLESWGLKGLAPRGLGSWGMAGPGARALRASIGTGEGLNPTAQVWPAALIPMHTTCPESSVGEGGWGER